MAQLDARPTGSQEVAGLILAGSATFFRGDFIKKYFQCILSLPLIQEGQLSVSGERMCTFFFSYLVVTHLFSPSVDIQRVGVGNLSAYLTNRIVLLYMQHNDFSYRVDP